MKVSKRLFESGKSVKSDSRKDDIKVLDNMMKNRGRRKTVTSDRSPLDLFSSLVAQKQREQKNGNDDSNLAQTKINPNNDS